MANSAVTMMLLRVCTAACTALAALALTTSTMLPLFTITSPIKHAKITQSLWATNIYSLVGGDVQLLASYEDSGIPLLDVVLRVGRMATVFGVAALALVCLYSLFCATQVLAPPRSCEFDVFGITIPNALMLVAVAGTLLTCCATQVLYETNWFDAAEKNTDALRDRGFGEPVVTVAEAMAACDPFDGCLTSFRASKFHGAAGWALMWVAMAFAAAAYCFEQMAEEDDEDVVDNTSATDIDDVVVEKALMQSSSDNGDDDDVKNVV